MTLKTFLMTALKRLPFLQRLYASLRWRILAAARTETSALINDLDARTTERIDILRTEFAARMSEAIDPLRAEIAARFEEIESLRAELNHSRHELRSVETAQREAAVSITSVRAELLVHEAFSQGRVTLGVAVPDTDLRISVVMPTLNRAHLLTRAIASVCSQTYPHWELLIIDDGSIDDTAAVVAGIGDPRITYVKQEHRGHSAARNHALRLATGDVICYLDSDNTYFPIYLATVATAFSQNAALQFAYGALRSEHHGNPLNIKFQPFDREKLLAANYIDTNVIAHRRALVAIEGGFDESLSRLTDWDLALKYSKDHEPALLPVIAALYGAEEDNRVSLTSDLGYNYFKIRQKWRPEPSQPPIRILYVVWHYPQLSESYIEAEIQGFRRLGAQIEVWREVKPASPYPSVVRIHDGPIEDVMESFEPDVIHVHWLGFALSQEPILARINRPVTVRLHGFEVTRETLAELLKRSWVSRIYAFPHQLALTQTVDPRIRPLRSMFDTSLFAPGHDKQRRMVLRTAAALESKDLHIMFELARRLPDFKVVLAVVTCNHKEHYVQVLRDQHRELQSSVELLVDVPRDEIAKLVKQAGIYIQTARRPGQEFATPIGMPIGIAEAMATGCVVLAPDLPEFAGYLAGTNALYRDVDEAVSLIAETRDWTDRQWRQAWIKSVDLAFGRHADELVLCDVLDDLRELACRVA